MQMLRTFCLMVFNASFNNISVISWRSVLLVEKTFDQMLQVTDILYHIMLYQSTPRYERARAHNCASNYHTITATTAP